MISVPVHPVHAMKAYVGSEQRYSSTDSSTQHWMRSCPGHFSPSERNWYRLNSGDGQFGEGENDLLLPWSSGPQDCHYNDSATLAATVKRVWSKAHIIYGCSLLCVSDESHNGKVTFMYTYKLDVITPTVFPSPLLGKFSLTVDTWKKRNMTSFWIQIK